jgi:heat-inducible transcriptional repressor
MLDLTARQILILRAVIEEYIETAEPVGSDTIDKKYSIGFSPATIRNEMVYLTKQGYLVKEHSSSGRIPTPLAMKLYVNELMKERELSVADEVSVKEKVWKNRQDYHDLLHAVTEALADKTRSLGIALTQDRDVYHSGYANLLNMPEFYDVDVMRHVLTLIEEVSLLEEIFNNESSEDLVRVVFGPELGNRHLEPIGLVFMRVKARDLTCSLGVIGSPRFDYPTLFPMLRYMRGLLEEMVDKQK